MNKPLLKLKAKETLSKSIRIASIALILAPFPKTLLAEEVSNATSLETLTVEGNALYDVESSEELTGYNVEAATVGTKTPAALKDIPQSITVLTNDFIEDQGAVYLDDLTKVTPGLRTLSNDSGRSSIYSRGYEYNEALIDGLPATISSVAGTLPSLSAFDHIEIMRGPSGLFSSTGELGGVINLVRKRATEDYQASIDVAAGSWERTQLGADVSGSLNDDGSVRGRLVIKQDDMPSEVDGNENLNQSFYATVEMDLDDKTILSVGVLHQIKELSPNNGLPAYADGTLLDVDQSTFIGADWNEFNSESTDLFLDVTRQFENGGRGRIATRVTERSRNQEYAYSFDSVDESDDTFSSIYAETGEYEENSIAFDANYSQPFELMGNVSEFVVGTDYKDNNSNSTTAGDSITGTYSATNFDSSAITRSLFDFSSTSDSESGDSEIGIYGKLTFRPIENLAIISGARFSHYTIESSGSDDSGSELTPYAGLVYDLSDSHALYASYSQVFSPQTETDENDDIIDPRVGQQYEIGLKGAYYNGLLNSRLTAFQLTDKNRAYENDDGENEASGKVRVSGFEAELSGQYGNWDLLMGYTYMDTEKLSGDDESNFASMPMHTLTSWAKYTVPSIDGLAIGAGITAMSDFYFERGTRVSAPGYTLIDTSISKQINENLKLSLKVNNLLDKKYYQRVASTRVFNFYGPSRNFMVSANYTF
ncbi:MAG: TonB-dependent siderophore receptor [Marinomonas sp.]